MNIASSLRTGLMVTAFAFPFISNAGPLNYECKTIEANPRIEHFRLTLEDKKLEGSIKGSPRRGEKMQTYQMGTERDSTLKLLPDTLQIAKESAIFYTRWKGGREYAVMFAVQTKDAIAILMEPEGITTERFDCELVKQP